MDKQSIFRKTILQHFIIWSDEVLRIITYNICHRESVGLRRCNDGDQVFQSTIAIKSAENADL